MLREPWLLDGRRPLRAAAASLLVVLPRVILLLLDDTKAEAPRSPLSLTPPLFLVDDDHGSGRGAEAQAPPNASRCEWCRDTDVLLGVLPLGL